jgi:hypothetical protein
MAAKAAKAPKKAAKVARKKTQKGVKLSPAAKSAYGDIKQGIKHVEKSIGEVQKGLRKAEKAIEAEAKTRIRELRKEGKAQLSILQAKRKEATLLMKDLGSAAEDSWHAIQASAEQAFADARSTAGSIADRIRAALQR